MTTLEWDKLEVNDIVQYIIADLHNNMVTHQGIVKMFNFDRTQVFVQYESYSIWNTKEELD